MTALLSISLEKTTYVPTDKHGSDAHAFRTSWLCRDFANGLRLGERHVNEITLAGRYHDIGKQLLDGRTLNQARPLSSVDRDVIETHPTLGVELLKTMGAQLGDSFAACLDGAEFHHERWDGRGYPHGLAGMNIPLVARIISIVDVFDALISARPYKLAWDVGRALEYIRYHSETIFDPVLASAFEAHIRSLAPNWRQQAHEYQATQVDLTRSIGTTVGLV